MPELTGAQRRTAGGGYRLQPTGAWRCTQGCDPRWQRAHDPATALEVHDRLHHRKGEPDDHDD